MAYLGKTGEIESSILLEIKCPECGAPLAHRSGCIECPSCGFALCAS